MGEESAKLSGAVYRLRNARPADRLGLLELAQILNTLNLPPDASVIEELLEGSKQAFSSNSSDPFVASRHWTFVLEDSSGKVVGTSALHAQHGTPEAPHTFFVVEKEPRQTQLHTAPPHALQRTLTSLQLKQCFDGPTEVGGLVLSPECRGRPGKLGTLLSLGRFMLVALHRNLFRPQMLAEVLPPLMRDDQGEPTSPLWDALGEKFTGLSYNEADKLSRTHFELMPSMFPSGRIYKELLPQAAQEVIGVVGGPSQGAAHLLRKIGFYDSQEVDPFDGGPHLHAQTEGLAPLRLGSMATLAVESIAAPQGFALIAHDIPASPEFRALRLPFVLDGGRVVVEENGAQGLEASAGDRVWVWPETALA